jgi:hypothetical protein
MEVRSIPLPSRVGKTESMTLVTEGLTLAERRYESAFRMEDGIPLLKTTG